MTRYFLLFFFFIRPSASENLENVTSSAEKLFEQYEFDAETSKICTTESGVPYMVSLIIEISTFSMKHEVPVLLYDNYFFITFKFQVILEKLLKLYPKTLRHGLIDTSMAKPTVPKGLLVPRENEQLAFFVFSKEADVGADAILDFINPNVKVVLIPQSTLYQIKEFLVSNIARRFHNILVLVDPLLSVELYLKKSTPTLNKCDIRLYTHHLLTDSLGSSAAQIITTWRRDRFTRQVDLFPDKFKNGFNGIHLVASSAETPPFIFRKKGIDSGEGYAVTQWDGYEVRFLNLIGSMLNFSVEYVEPSDSGYGNLSNAELILRELSAKKSDIAIGGIYMTSEWNQNVKFTFPYIQDCASFISLTSTALPKFRAIMGPFLWDVWLALTAVYLLAMFPIAFSFWHSLKPLLHDIGELENMFWYVFGTFTNCFTFSGRNSWSKGDKSATRLFIGTYWIFSIIITACYTGSIIAFITLPVYPEVIDTSKQLLAEHYKISTLGYEEWDNMFTKSVDPVAHYLYKDLDYVYNLIDGLRNVTRNVHSDRQSAFLGSRALLEYAVRANYTSEEPNKRLLFHLSKECFVPLMVSMAFPKDSLYLEKFNLAMARAVQSGFKEKVRREVDWTIYRTVTGKLLNAHSTGLRRTPEDRELTLDDTQGMFVLLGSGFAIAFAALTTELIIWCVREVKGKKFGEKTLKDRAYNKAKENLSGITNCLMSPLDQYRHSFAGHSFLGHSFYRRNSKVSRVFNLFGSVVSNPPSQDGSATSMIHLHPPPEKPIRLRSF